MHFALHIGSKQNVLEALSQTWQLQLNRLLKKYVTKMQTWFRQKRQERLEREDARSAHKLPHPPRMSMQWVFWILFWVGWLVVL